jgi:hypothetical protein
MRKNKKTDKGRRKFLKLLAFGGLALVAAKIFGGKSAALAAPVPVRPTGKKTGGDKTASEEIDIIDKNDQVVFVDKKTGEEILILEKD